MVLYEEAKRVLQFCSTIHSCELPAVDIESGRIKVHIQLPLTLRTLVHHSNMFIILYTTTKG